MEINRLASALGQWPDRGDGGLGEFGSVELAKL
jgi:hypothetical protein